MASLKRFTRAVEHPAEHDKPLIGILYKVVSVFTLAVMNSAVKWLGPDFSTGQVMFYRSFFALPPVIIAALLGGGLVMLKPNRFEIGRAHV